MSKNVLHQQPSLADGPEDDQPLHVVILGGGVAGLAAAFELSMIAPDTEITILESEERTGGLAQTIEWAGCQLDLGPHRFYTEIKEAGELVQRICAQQLIRVKRKSRMWLRERWLTYPVRPHEVLGALGWKQAFRAGCSALQVLKRNTEQPPQTYSEYIRAYYGEELSRLLFEPYAKKVWGIEPYELSAETAILRLRGDNIWHSLWDSIKGGGETYVKEFLYPVGGIGAIADGLEQRIRTSGVRIHTGIQIQKLLADEDDGSIHRIVYNKDGARRSLDCDAVISTVPLPSLSNLLENELSEVAHAACHKLEYRSLILLFLLYERDLDIKDTWLYFPEAEVPFSRLSLAGNFETSCVPQGHTVITIELPCTFNDEHWQSPDQHLADFAAPFLEKTGLVRGTADEIMAVRLRWGYPTYTLHTKKALSKIYDELGKFPNLISTGRQGLFRHNNLDQSIHMGLLAARHVGRLLNGEGAGEAKDWYAQVSQFDAYRIVD